MKAHNHRCARVKIYQGRSHTRKQNNNLKSPQSAAQKTAARKKRRTASAGKPKIIHIHYQPYCKLKQLSRKVKKLRSSGLKSLPFRGDLEGLAL